MPIQKRLSPLPLLMADESRTSLLLKPEMVIVVATGKIITRIANLNANHKPLRLTRNPLLPTFNREVARNGKAGATTLHAGPAIENLTSITANNGHADTETPVAVPTPDAEGKPDVAPIPADE